MMEELLMMLVNNQEPIYIKLDILELVDLNSHAVEIRQKAHRDIKNNGKNDSRAKIRKKRNIRVSTRRTSK